jgi:tRNA (mo5U34)-methyltransferase
MPTVLTRDGLAVDAVWSPEQVAYFQNEIERRKSSAGWYHDITIKDGAGHSVRTPGTHPGVAVLATLERFGFPKDFTGKTVLDIGCNAGFYSSIAKVRGARSVLGLEYFQHSVDQALLVREILQLDTEFRQGDGENLDEKLGPFDVVIATGVLYHLQNPMRFLSNMARVTSEVMFLESEMLVDPRLTEYSWFIEHEYIRDVSNWWIHGPETVARMARAAGFSRAEFQGFAWTPSQGEKTPEGLDRQGRGVMLCWK